MEKTVVLFCCAERQIYTYWRADTQAVVKLSTCMLRQNHAGIEPIHRLIWTAFVMLKRTVHLC